MTPGTPPVIDTVASQAANATYSRDGRWLALASRRSGRQEVYVAPAAEPERITRVSIGGGSEPVVGRPTQITTLRRVEPGLSISVLPDGRIVVLQGSRMSDASELRLILNWFDDLRRRVPTR